LGFALGALFLYLAFQGIDWAKVRSQLADVSPVAIVLAVVLILGSAGLRSIRWRLVFIDEPVRFSRLFLVENAALGLNNISPVRLLDEPVILTMLTLRDRIPAGSVVASLVMTRIQDIGATLMLVAIALIVEPTLQSFLVAGILPSIFIILALAGLLNLGRLSRRFSMLNRIPGVAKYEETVSAFMRYKRRLAASMLFTLAYPLFLGPAAYFLARGMGLDLSLVQATIIVLASITFATATPGLPGAIGAFELAAVELASIWGVPRSLALGYGLILHLVLFLPPVTIALLVLPHEGISLWRRPRARAERTLDS
jgi:uncharacterized protein (TIRG00374 family)